MRLDSEAGEKPGFSDLIEQGYRCAAEPERWPDFLRRLVQRSNSRSGRMLVLNAQADEVFDSVKYNIDTDYHRQYVEHYVNLCPWRPELNAKAAGRFYSTFHDFSCPQKAFYRTEFFNDWARPQDVHHGMLGSIARTETETVQLLLQRTRGQGAYSPEETGYFNDLVPHLQRILRLGREFSRQRLIDQAALKAASESASPFMLLDAAGEVVYRSARVDALLDATRQLRLGRRGLEAPGGLGKRLQALIRSCLQAPMGRWGEAGGSLRLGDGSGLFLTITPVHPDHPLLALERPTYVAVFLHSPANRPRFCWKTLRALYGLTPAESRLATHLAEGESLQHIAEQTGVSMNTLRSQLKSVFRKTGAGRQSELVVLLVSGPAMRLRDDLPLSLNRSPHRSPE